MRSSSWGNQQVRPTLASVKTDLSTNAAVRANTEIMVGQTYGGISPIDIPATTGILIPYIFSPGINPPGLLTAGQVVPEVVIFQEPQGYQYVTLNATFTVNGSFGARNWAYRAEIGTNLDSLTPDPPFGTFQVTGSSSNQVLTVSMSRTFEALVTLDGIQIQLILEHDGGVTINTSISNLSVTTTGASSGFFDRLR